MVRSREPFSADRPPPARKRLGQHFLHDARVLEKIAGALELTGSETVLEIGPGRGALTDLLAARARRVIAVELDRALVPILRDRYAQAPRVEIVEGDVLDLRLADIAGDDYVLAGNVPYYITTPILFHGLEPPRPARAVYLVQYEVAQRLTARPGSKTYGALSVNVQAVATVELIARVPPGAFQPPPTVDSAIVRVMPRADPVVASPEEARFRELVIAAFGMRRKQMRRVVRSLASVSAPEADRILAETVIDAEARPETLSAEAFARLTRALSRG